MRARGVILALAALLAFPVIVVVGQQSSEERGTSLRDWISTDVDFIISPEEREAYKLLTTDEQRYQFQEAFWRRRDPTPESSDNPAREEHYRRIAYANEHFSSGIPGWQTDRGRIYILHGEPTSIEERMPTGGAYRRPDQLGGGATTVFPFERWRYRNIPGWGNEVEFEFVDFSMSGEYRLAMTPHDKDALANVPELGLTEREIALGIDKAERWNTDFARLGTGNSVTDSRLNSFDYLQAYMDSYRPPQIQFKDLEAIVDTRLLFNDFPFKYRADFIRVSETQMQVPITIEIAHRDLAFQNTNGIYEAHVRIYGVITSITGQVVERFDHARAIQEPASTYRQTLDRKVALYQRQVLLPPGTYKIDLVVEDIRTQNKGTMSRNLSPPRLSDGRLATSSLILADRSYPLSAREIGAGQFVIGGGDFVRPSVSEQFFPEQELNIWMQVYGLKLDGETRRPSATVEYVITKDGREVMKIQEDSSDISSAAMQMTLRQRVLLSEFDPGEYGVQVMVRDNLAEDLILSTGKFVVRQ